jgi:hypothetical protein
LRKEAFAIAFPRACSRFYTHSANGIEAVQANPFLAHRRRFHDSLPTASTCSRAAQLTKSALHNRKEGALGARLGGQKAAYCALAFRTESNLRYLGADRRSLRGRFGMKNLSHVRARIMGIPGVVFKAKKEIVVRMPREGFDDEMVPSDYSCCIGSLCRR